MDGFVASRATPASVSPLRPARAVESATPKVTVAVKDADVRDVLTFLAKRGRRNIIMGDGVRGRLTLVLRDVSVATAITAIVKLQGYEMSRHDNVTWVRVRRARRGGN